MLHFVIRSLDITSSTPAKEHLLANAPMSLLDLQGMQLSSGHKAGILDDTVESGLSILLCD